MAAFCRRLRRGGGSSGGGRGRDDTMKASGVSVGSRRVKRKYHEAFFCRHIVVRSSDIADEMFRRQWEMRIEEHRLL